MDVVSFSEEYFDLSVKRRKEVWETILNNYSGRIDHDVLDMIAKLKDDPDHTYAEDVLGYLEMVEGDDGFGTEGMRL